jgi:PKD repeat protein
MKQYMYLFALLAVTFLSCNAGKPEPEPDLPSVPVAKFSAEIEWMKVSLTNESTDADTWSWDFGDQTAVNTEENPVHEYLSEGSYTITLTATGEGGNDNTTRQVTVEKDPFPSSIRQEAAIRIAESNNHAIDFNMLGLGWGIHYQSGVIMEGPTSTVIKQEYKEMAKQLRNTFPVSRLHGGESSFFCYTDNIGPYDERISRPAPWLVNMPPGTDAPRTLWTTNVGPAEWMKACYELTPDMEFIICLNLITGTPEESAAAAQYFTGAASTEWGAKRVRDGISAPAKIAMYELGNEINWGFRGFDEMEYVRVCKLHIAAVKAVDPTAKFAICGGNVLDWSTGPTGQDWREWNRVTARELKNDVDYITHHPYHSGTPLAVMEQYMDVLHEDVVNSAGRMLPIVHTEHAKWPTDMSVHSMDPIQLEGTLAVAEFYNRMYQRGDVWGATYFIACAERDNYWSIFNYFGNSGLVLSGMGHMHNAYRRGVGDRALKSEVTGSLAANPKLSGSSFSVLASAKGNEDLYLILVNRSNTMWFDLSFSFENRYRLVEETIFTAPSLQSYVRSASTVDIFTTTTTVKNEDNFQSYKMRKKSMIILKLRKM